MAKNHNQIQHEILVAKGKVFLDVLRETANISQACKVADVTRGVIYRERERDPQFAMDWETAIEEACDKLLGEMWRRGVEGVEEPLYQGGGPVMIQDPNDEEKTVQATVRKHSDRMLELLAKAHMPEKFVDKLRVEGKGMGGMQIDVYTSQEAFAVMANFAPDVYGLIGQNSVDDEGREGLEGDGRSGKGEPASVRRLNGRGDGQGGKTARIPRDNSAVLVDLRGGETELPHHGATRARQDDADYPPDGLQGGEEHEDEGGPGLA